MSSTITYPYTTASNYTYDSDLIEITGGVARLVDLTPTDGIFGASFLVDENGDWGDDTLTGTLVSGAVVTGGFLDLSAGANAHCKLTGGNNLPTSIGCVRLRLKSDFTGTPASTQYIMASDGTQQFYMRIEADGSLRLTVKTDAGASGIDLISSPLTWTTGQTYELEFNWDLDGSIGNIYRDATRIGEETTFNTVRTNPGTFLYVGAYSNGTAGITSDIKDLEIYDAVQNTGTTRTTGYTPVYSRYSTATPTVVTNSTFIASELLTFAETSTGTIKHTILKGGSDFWSNGGTVEASNGTYSQANTAAEITAVIGDFLSTRTTVSIKSFLYSDGDTSPELDLITITYDSALPDPEVPVSFDLEGFIYGHDGPIEGLQLYIRPYQAGFQSSGVFHPYLFEELGQATNSEGYFETNLYLPPSEYYWELKIGKQRYKMELPGGIIEDSEINLSDTTLTLIED